MGLLQGKSLRKNVHFSGQYIPPAGKQKSHPDGSGRLDWKRFFSDRLRKQVDRAGLLDRVGDLAVKLGGDTGDAARKDLAGFGGELGQKLRIGGDDEVSRDIVPTTRHHAVRLTEIDTALDCFWLGHGSGGGC